MLSIGSERVIECRLAIPDTKTSACSQESISVVSGGPQNNESCPVEGSGAIKEQNKSSSQDEGIFSSNKPTDQHGSNDPDPHAIPPKNAMRFRIKPSLHEVE
jgi:hypothetical protein